MRQHRLASLRTLLQQLKLISDQIHHRAHTLRGVEEQEADALVRVNDMLQDVISEISRLAEEKLPKGS